jgi:hypothetical protein
MVQGQSVTFPQVGNDSRDNGFFACSKVHLTGDQTVVPEFSNGFFEQATFKHKRVKRPYIGRHNKLLSLSMTKAAGSTWWPSMTAPARKWMTIRNASGERVASEPRQSWQGGMSTAPIPWHALLTASNLFLYDFDYLIDYLFKFDYLYVAYAVKNDVIICGEKSVGHGEGNDNNIPLYKLCHALSSSCLSQSFAKDDSLITAV